MTEGLGCGAGAPSLAELAAGAMAGQERALALQHVAGCPACRRELAALTQAADALLLLAPSSEPPAGFESTVLAGLTGPRRRRVLPVRRRLLAAAAAVVLAAGAGAGAVWWRTADDRNVAAHYRETLANANGRYFKATPLDTAAGERAGTVFLYQGNPSWVMVTVSSAANGRYAITVVGPDGVAEPIGNCVITDGTGTAGYRLTRPVAQVGTVELRGTDGTRLVAAF